MTFIKQVQKHQKKGHMVCHLSLVKMMNQQKMIKLVRLRSVVGGYLV